MLLRISTASTLFSKYQDLFEVRLDGEVAEDEAAVWAGVFREAVEEVEPVAVAAAPWPLREP